MESGSRKSEQITTCRVIFLLLDHLLQNLVGVTPGFYRSRLIPLVRSARVRLLASETVGMGRWLMVHHHASLPPPPQSNKDLRAAMGLRGQPGEVKRVGGEHPQQRTVLDHATA